MHYYSNVDNLYDNIHVSEYSLKKMLAVCETYQN